MAADIQITIKRADPKATQESGQKVFSLKYEEGMTLHNALQRIYQDQDPSLAYRPFSCNKGTCLSCLVAVNGKTRQACTTLLKPGDCISLEAETTRPLVRDLVTVPKDSKGD